LERQKVFQRAALPLRGNLIIGCLALFILVKLRRGLSQFFPNIKKKKKKNTHNIEMIQVFLKKKKNIQDLG
jgi:hypothetical protein